jgi:hypothetical protein
MTAQPADRIPASGPDTVPYEVIQLGGEAAVVVPSSDLLRLRALGQAASPQEREDAEDKAALADWRAREAAGQTSKVLQFPGFQPVVELWISADSAKAQAGYDSLTLAVRDRAALDSWSNRLDDLAIAHSEILTAIDSWLLVVEDPDGHRMRFYSPLRAEPISPQQLTSEPRVHSRDAVNWCQLMAGSGGSQAFPAMTSRMAPSAVMLAHDLGRPSPPRSDGVPALVIPRRRVLRASAPHRRARRRDSERPRRAGPRTVV